VRTFVHDAADVGAGDGIFQVGGGGERAHSSIGKFFGEDAREAGEKLFAGDASGVARGIGEQKFQAAGLGAAEAPHFQDDAVAGGFFDARNAAGEVAFVGPEMHERIFACDAQLEMQRGEFGEPFAVFAHRDAAGGGEVAQRAIQRRPIVCERIQRYTVMGLLCRVEDTCGGYCELLQV
jgi:hypothetical protein